MRGWFFPDPGFCWTVLVNAGAAAAVNVQPGGRAPARGRTTLGPARPGTGLAARQGRCHRVVTDMADRPAGIPGSGPMSSALPGSHTCQLVHAVAEAGMALPEGSVARAEAQGQVGAFEFFRSLMWLDTMELGYRAWRCC
jgi:hypothetical protein